jgi:hypothetical protein
MKRPLAPLNQPESLTLESYSIMDSLPEEEYDSIITVSFSIFVEPLSP